MVSAGHSYPKALNDGQLDTDQFDYSIVSSKVASFLRGQAERIRRYATNSIIEIGKHLIIAKGYLSHGTFQNWVESEVGISRRTAQAYMQVAQWSADKDKRIGLLRPSVLYLLSAPSTPDSFVAEVLGRFEHGEDLRASIVRAQLKCRHAQPADGLDDVDCDVADSMAHVEASDKSLASLRKVVCMLARKLSRTEFDRVRSIMTSEAVLNDPGLAVNIGEAFNGNVKSLIDKEMASGT